MAGYHQGVDKVLRVKVWADDAKTQPKDLTGATVWVRIGDVQLADQVVKYLEKAGVVQDAAQGVMKVRLTRTDTRGIPAGLIQHQFYVRDADDILDVVADPLIEVFPGLPA